MRTLTAEGSYLSYAYAYTSSGPTETPTAPDEFGDYEIRYASAGAGDLCHDRYRGD